MRSPSPTLEATRQVKQMVASMPRSLRAQVTVQGKITADFEKQLVSEGIMSREAVTVLKYMVSVFWQNAVARASQPDLA